MMLRYALLACHHHGLDHSCIWLSREHLVSGRHISTSLVPHTELRADTIHTYTWGEVEICSLIMSPPPSSFSSSLWPSSTR
jgi:hypothetical protein